MDTPLPIVGISELDNLSQDLPTVQPNQVQLMKVLDIEAPANILALELMTSVHWGRQRGCERRDLRSDFDREYVCSSLWWGVVKSLTPIGGGPVGLVRTQKVRIK